MVAGLKKKCTSIIMRGLGVDNAVDIAYLADKYLSFPHALFPLCVMRHDCEKI